MPLIREKASLRDIDRIKKITKEIRDLESKQRGLSTPKDKDKSGKPKTRLEFKNKEQLNNAVKDYIEDNLEAIVEEHQWQVLEYLEICGIITPKDDYEGYWYSSNEQMMSKLEPKKEEKEEDQ